MSAGPTSIGIPIIRLFHYLFQTAKFIVLGALNNWFEKEIKEILGIPENVDTAALLPPAYRKCGTRLGPTTLQSVKR